MNKCQFCGITNESVLKENDELMLCCDCSASREKLMEENMKEELKVVETEFEEVQENVEGEEMTGTEAKTAIKCEITLGMRHDGGLYFNAAGDDPNLLTIEGLLEFGKRRLKSIWEERDAEITRAQQAQAQTEE